MMRTAAAFPDRVGGGCSFHGGDLVTDKPDSPHLLVPKMNGSYLFAIAANDDMRDPKAKDVLRKAFDDAHGSREGGDRGLHGNDARLVSDGRGRLQPRDGGESLDPPARDVQDCAGLTDRRTAPVPGPRPYASRRGICMPIQTGLPEQLTWIDNVNRGDHSSSRRRIAARSSASSGQARGGAAARPINSSPISNARPHRSGASPAVSGSAPSRARHRRGRRRAAQPVHPRRGRAALHVVPFDVQAARTPRVLRSPRALAATRLRRLSRRYPAVAAAGGEHACRSSERR